MPKVYSIGGKSVVFYSITDLAKSTKRTKYSIYNLEVTGTLPSPNFRTKPKFRKKKVPNISQEEYVNYKSLYFEYLAGNASLKDLEVGIKSLQIMDGDRLYSEFIFSDLCKIINGIRKGIKISDSVKLEIKNLFVTEKSKVYEN